MTRELSKKLEYRYERKFNLSELTKYEVECMIKLHPAIFLEIYEERFVNNLYLDSFDRRNYLESVDGVKNRVKIRIRWYGKLFGLIQEPVLEFKIKDGVVGRKERFAIQPFWIDKERRLDSVVQMDENGEVPDAVKMRLGNMEASVLNRYKRKYYQSADRKFRITVDSEMEHYFVDRGRNSFLARSVDRVNTILELKYAVEEDEYVKRIVEHFPCRVVRNSKYVSGVESLYVW